MPGGSRSPYRAPCGYSADDPERYWLGGPWQHYVPAAADLPFYRNTTTVPNYEAGPATIPPYATLNEAYADGECGGTGQVACGPWVDPPANTFGPFSPAETKTLAACRKVGFKTVFARKFWQGRFGFGDPDQCAGCGIAVGSPTQTKYLTLSWTATWAALQDDMVTTFGFTSTGTCTVDQHSGLISGAVSFETTNSNQWYDPPSGNDVCISGDGGSGDLANAFALNYCDGTWTSTGTGDNPLADMLNAGSTEYITITTATCTSTQIIIEYTSTLGGATTTSSVTLTLSNPYTAADVDTDVEAALACWNLADDVQIPWRSDSACTSGPYLSYDETTNNQPIGELPGPVECPDTGPVTGVTADVTTGAVQGTYTFNWNPAAIDDYAPSSCSFSGSFVDTETNTGAILGKPLTTIYGTGVVYGPYFDFDHWNYNTVACNGGGSGYDVTSYGAFGGASATSTPYPYTFNASQWTDLADASALLPGAFAAFGSHTNGGGLTVTLSACGDGGGGTYMPGYLIKSKYAEVILLTQPSHDFDRPCGPKDDETIDQTTITTCAGADSPCNLGTLRSATDWITGAVTCPDDGWNDNRPKGDWLLYTWSTNFRAAMGGTVTPAATQMCSEFIPCCPAIIYLSNGGEASTNSQIVAVPALTLDACYGALWVSCPMQWMTDPLWQVPAMSEACHYNGGAGHPGSWLEDDGTGQGQTGELYYYAQRPYEEARLSVPSGAPGLPGDASLPTASSIAPPSCGGCFMPVWVWALNRQATIAANGNFSCDYADPFAVCSDNTELQL